MEIKYDPIADALDILIKDGKVFETKEISPEVYLDVDEKGRLLSIEILGVRERYYGKYQERKTPRRLVKAG